MAKALQVQLKGDMEKLLRDVGHVLPKDLRTAQVRGLNHAARRVQTLAIRRTAKGTGVKSKNIRKRVKMRSATRRVRSALITIFTQPISAVSNLTPAQRERYRARPPHKERPRSGPRTAGKKYPDAFVAKGIGGYEQLFRRKGKSRLPIEAIKIRVAAEFKNNTERYNRRLGPKEFRKEFLRQIDMLRKRRGMA